MYLTSYLFHTISVFSVLHILALFYKIWHLNEKKSSFFIAALPLAPSYCSKHRVTSQGWNYPVPRGEDTMDREFTADLSIQLPYHVPPEGFRMSSDSRLVE